MKLNIVIFMALSLLGAGGMAATKDKAQPKTSEASPSKKGDLSYKSVDAIFAKLKNSDSFRLDVIKVSQVMFGGKKTYEGSIEVLGERFRWDNERPVKSLILYDGENLWSVEDPPPGTGSKPLVTKQKVDKEAGAEQPIFKLLRRKEALSKQFKIVEFEPKEKSKYEFYKLEPHTGSWTVKNLVVTIDPKSNTLKGIRYEDDIGNKTFLQFSNIRLGVDIAKSRFAYAPPPGAVVTEI